MNLPINFNVSWVAGSGKFIPTIGQRVGGSKQLVGCGIGGKWTLNMGGTWDVGCWPQKQVGLRLKPLPHIHPAGLPTRS